MLRNNGGSDLAVATNGSFAFAAKIADGATYDVAVRTQPTAPAQTCSVTNGAGSVAGADVTSVSVDCTTNTYAIRASVSGVTASGLVLRYAGGDDLPVATSGTVTLATTVASGSTYAVTVAAHPTGQACSVTGGSGTVDSSDVTVTVTCATAYTVGGTVSGLAGTGLVLRNEGGDTLEIDADGAFTFPTPVASGGAYAVTVRSAPRNPPQVCEGCGSAPATAAGTAADPRPRRARAACAPRSGSWRRS